jgi:phage terminase large subunit-like protein
MAVDSRWIKTKADKRAVELGCYFDEAAAQRVIDFCEQFIRMPGSGISWQQGDYLKLAEYQKEIIYPLFGWKLADGRRRFRRAYVEIPKKNGKTGLCAALGLYMLMADGEPYAEVYSAALDSKQAKIVFNEAKKYAEHSPDLQPLLTPTESKQLLTYADTGSFWKVFAGSDSGKNLAGFNIHCLIFDEFSFSNPTTYNFLKASGSARRQSLHFYITTAGFDRLSPAWQLREYTRNIEAGLCDDITHFGYIRSAEGLDWTTPEAWHAANPTLGTLIDPILFEAECKQAQAIPQEENTFKRDRLCIWTEQEARAGLSVEWPRGAEPIDLEELEGEPCFVGVDLGWVSDFSSAGVVFFREDRVTVLSLCWCAQHNAAKKDQRLDGHYTEWARKGYGIKEDGKPDLPYLTLTDKYPLVTDNERIVQDVIALSERFNIVRLGIDRFNADDVGEKLQDAGIEVYNFKFNKLHLNQPYRVLQQLVLSGRIQHGGNPMLEWQVGNLVIDTDGQLVMPSKKKSLDKIDGIAALCIALGVADKQLDVDWNIR